MTDEIDTHKDAVIRELDQPSLYVGTYAKYNGGSIKGAWLSLADYPSKEEFLAAARELHKDEADPELMYQDCDNVPRELYDESSLDDRLFEYAQMDDHDRELVVEYADAIGSLPDDLSEAVDAYFTELDEHNRERQFGEYLIDEGLFGVDIPDDLASYLDYEAIGRDALMDFSVSDSGFVFSNH